MHDVSLYFDFVSPYSWLALTRAPAFGAAHRVRWQPRPVVYARLLDHHGLVGPAESAAKRRYTFFDVARSAEQLDLSFVGPPAHPFRSLEALRVAVLFTEHPGLLELCGALADAAWGQGRDLTDLAVLEDLVAGAGLDATDLGARIREPAVKQRLRELTAGAIEAGVFGVPTFGWNDELFWGHDRMDQLAARLSGRLAAPRSRAESMLSRPRGVDRRRS